MGSTSSQESYKGLQFFLLGLRRVIPLNQLYFHRQFPSQVSLFSVYNAVFVSVGGVASSWGGGAIADR